MMLCSLFGHVFAFALKEGGRASEERREKGCEGGGSLHLPLPVLVVAVLLTCARKRCV